MNNFCILCYCCLSCVYKRDDCGIQTTSSIHQNPPICYKRNSSNTWAPGKWKHHCTLTIAVHTADLICMVSWIRDCLHNSIDTWGLSDEVTLHWTFMHQYRREKETEGRRVESKVVKEVLSLEESAPGTVRWREDTGGYHPEVKSS